LENSTKYNVATTVVAVAAPEAALFLVWRATVVDEPSGTAGRALTLWTLRVA
jgi:hypothetical protein